MSRISLTLKQGGGEIRRNIPKIESTERKIFIKNIPDPKKADEKILHQTVVALVAQANANGGNDNISVILVVAQ